MAQIPVVFGEWVMRSGSWHFDIDAWKGGRMFFLRNSCTYAELVEMATEDYMVDKGTEMVHLSYPLTDMMLKQLPQDTPPVYITNDRSLQNFIEFSTVHVVRLCVSTRCMDEQPSVKEFDTDSNNSLSDADGEPSDEFGNDLNMHTLEDDDDDDDSGSKECAEAAATTDHVEHKPNDVDEMDFDYSEYGKFEDDDDNGVGVEPEEGKPFFGCIYGQLNNPWIDQLSVGQCFPCKDDVINEVRLAAVMLKFSFRIKKSNKSQLVAICYVPGCCWRVVAITKNDPNTFWVTKYVNVHTCSIADRGTHHRRCTSKYIGRLFIDRIGIIEGVVPHHIKQAMRTMFGMTMDYTTSYRALQYAQKYVRDSAESGYAKLPSCLRKIEQSNPGSVVDLVVDGEHRFKYLFIAFDASIRGFNYVRRVIVVDGTSTKL